jgi:outer membrane immunogenic protein
MRKVLLALATSLVIAAPAAARDFAGPYVGAGVTLDNVQGSGPNEGLGASGVGGTVFAGYDMPLSNKVFAGVEGNIDLYSADADLGGVTVKAKWSWGLSARLGYKLNDSTGLYTRVGYARAKVGASGPGFSESTWGDGVRYGAGLETRVTQAVSLRAEFTQFNYSHDIINNQGTMGVVFGF